MKKPAVLIVGRPNVGKSTLFNRLVGRRQSITANIPGVTRDVNEADVEFDGRRIKLMDSGGVFFQENDRDDFQLSVEDAVKKMEAKATRVIVLVDWKDGVHPVDQDIANWARQLDKPVKLVVNKVDDPAQGNVGGFMALGLGEGLAVSSINGNGLSDLIDWMMEGVGQKAEKQGTPIRFAFIGRPNVGKSSLLNAILNDNRVLVDNKAGTTRDSIEVPVVWSGSAYEIVDTAGIKRQSQLKDPIAYYSHLRSTEAIKQVDVVVGLLDADQFLTEQDKKIFRMILDEKKPLVIFVNKWDLVERSDGLRRELEKKAIRQFPALQHHPFIFGSAKDKHHLHRIFEQVKAVYGNNQYRVETAQLNRFIQAVFANHPPGIKHGRPIKMYYATQSDTNPPKFVIFVNRKTGIPVSYKRYIINKIREKLFQFYGCPIEISFRPRRG